MVDPNLLFARDRIFLLVVLFACFWCLFEKKRKEKKRKEKKRKEKKTHSTGLYWMLKMLPLTVNSCNDIMHHSLTYCLFLFSLFLPYEEEVQG